MQQTARARDRRPRRDRAKLGDSGDLEPERPEALRGLTLGIHLPRRAASASLCNGEGRFSGDFHVLGDLGVNRMIIGTGLIASAFAAQFRARSRVCIYAAGVSNSSCSDHREFERERLRLLQAIGTIASDCVLVYFSTCSVDDPEVQGSAYIGHKLAMEQLVRHRDRHLILRLPQLGGRSPNPHTLLNYLYARIVRSERFAIWRGAERNIIDVDDVVRLAVDLIVSEGACAETINIANVRNSGIFEIVASFEEAVGRKAIFDIIDRCAGYPINVERIRPALQRCGILFPLDYLPRIIGKYYGRHHEPIAT